MSGGKDATGQTGNDIGVGIEQMQVQALANSIAQLAQQAVMTQAKEDYKLTYGDSANLISDAQMGKNDAREKNEKCLYWSRTVATGGNYETSKSKKRRPNV